MVDKEQCTIGIPDDSKSSFSHVFGEKNSVRIIAHRIILFAWLYLVDNQIRKRLHLLGNWFGFVKVPFFVFPLCKWTIDGPWLLLVSVLFDQYSMI